MRYTDRTYIMGILNVTPDSFYDGGKFFDIEHAVKHAYEMIEQGADIVDIGGNSTRPGSVQVSPEEEFKRIEPVLKKLRKKKHVQLSVDTFYPEVAQKVIDLGVDIINDVTGLRENNGLAKIVAKNNTQIIIMHSKGEPKNMQEKPFYSDVINDVTCSLKRSIDIAKNAGIRDENIIIDPGIGFGKTIDHNIMIIKYLESFKKLMYPILLGVSRKSFIGKVIDKEDPKDRYRGSIAANVIGILNGANIIRVHDVEDMKEIALFCDRVKRVKMKEALIC
ncbi:MAG: dihydropteroate synthase [Candidatus Omnitrophica bacterium]|nr:dihydropteroate synthase [Candidatus Omnitrophota bacterium]